MSANIEIEIGPGNVYADLGFADAEEMVIKAGLAMKIAEIIKRKSYSQTEAANLVGLPQPKLSGLLRGQFRGISEAKMIEVLNALGRDVRIVVSQASRRSSAKGKTTVVFA